MAPSTDACHRVVRWCAATDLDYHKCSWLARAVETHDLSPRLECVQPAGPEKGIWGCYEAVNEGSADIVTSDSTYAEIARRLVPSIINSIVRNCKKLRIRSLT